MLDLSFQGDPFRLKFLRGPMACEIQIPRFHGLPKEIFHLIGEPHLFSGFTVGQFGRISLQMIKASLLGH